MEAAARTINGQHTKLPEIHNTHCYSYSGSPNIRNAKKRAQRKRGTYVPPPNNYILRRRVPNDEDKPCTVGYGESQRKSTGEAPPPPVANFRGKKKFRAMARMVKNQLAWTKQMAQYAEEHMKTYTVQDLEGTETLTFDVNAFRPEVQSCGGLSPQAKAILMKPSWCRSEEEIKFLHQFTLRLKCFDRYPVYVRRELARVLYYEAFEKERVVIRQGDCGFNFYFIVSGNVLVEVQEEDHVTGKKLNTIVGELGSGSAFGELALLHDARRRATIVCKENTEFLKVDKSDFDMVLRKNHEREWNTRMTHFEDHPIFAGWSSANLDFAVEGSQIVEYPPNSVILKDLLAPSEKVYFITRGTCKVVQRVNLLENVDSSKPSHKGFILPPVDVKQGCRVSKNNLRKVQKWWILRCLQPGDYFGVGEGQEGMSVVTDDKVECLLVNKMVFMKHERGKTLWNMQAEAAKMYPSRASAFESYIEMMKWKEYKQNVVTETVKKQRRRRTATQADVP